MPEFDTQYRNFFRPDGAWEACNAEYPNSIVKHGMYSVTEKRSKSIAYNTSTTLEERWELDILG